MTIETLKEKTAPIFKEHGVIKAAVFGSVARGGDRDESDLDLLVAVRRPYGLVQFVALKRRLEAVLKKSVDVVDYGAIKPAFEKNILKDAAIIYEQR